MASQWLWEEGTRNVSALPFDELEYKTVNTLRMKKNTLQLPPERGRSAGCGVPYTRLEPMDTLTPEGGREGD